MRCPCGVTTRDIALLDRDYNSALLGLVRAFKSFKTFNRFAPFKTFNEDNVPIVPVVPSQGSFQPIRSFKPSMNPSLDIVVSAADVDMPFGKLLARGVFERSSVRMQRIITDANVCNWGLTT